MLKTWPSGPQSLTLTAKGILRVIKSKCGVCQAHRRHHGIKHPKIVEFDGLWDTGASATVIDANVVKKLGLKPVGKTKAFHADGESIVDVYFINLYYLIM